MRCGPVGEAMCNHSTIALLSEEICSFPVGTSEEESFVLFHRPASTRTVVIGAAPKLALEPLHVSKKSHRKDDIMGDGKSGREFAHEMAAIFSSGKVM